jgi:hypothetical protein
MYKMPDFLNGKKQLSYMEANHSRCVVKARWIIESDMFINELSSILMTYLDFIITS